MTVATTGADAFPSHTPSPSEAADDAPLVQVLRRLKAAGYRFITPTPATHARVAGRPDRRVARDLADVLGWNLPFERGLIAPELEGLLEAADMVESAGPLLRSRLRVATLGPWLFLHSAFPTEEKDAVFFGPDSYRFADLVRAETRDFPLGAGARIVDIGGGTGVGAFVAAETYPEAVVAMTDINPRALALARINALAAGLPVVLIEGADLAGVDGPIALAVANPPYILDDSGRAYRDGGEGHGAAVSIGMAAMAGERLAPGGRLILYSGSAIVGGEDGLAAALAEMASRQGLRLRYREIDPDVFGEELDRPAYADVDRIAVIAAVFDRPAR